MHEMGLKKLVCDGQIDLRDRTQYLSGFNPRARLAGGQGRIMTIDITATAAAAKIELETADRIFTDYFNLLLDGDRWYIVDKVSSNVAKK